MIELPFPPASLSGHNKGNYHAKSPLVKRWREMAKEATIAAGIVAPETGDIRVGVTFYPSSRRGDRVNFPIRMKPIWDGIADALGVNDSRFLPAFHYAEPVKQGCVVITVAA